MSRTLLLAMVFFALAASSPAQFVPASLSTSLALPNEAASISGDSSSSLAVLPPPPVPAILKVESVPRPKPQGFQWRLALEQAMELVVIEHGYRLANEGGADMLRGPFWKNYVRSVGSVHGWDDGDPFGVNYIGHPIQGAVTGFIQVQNDPKYRSLEFNVSKDYWKSRLRAMAFSAAFEVQFEIGPLSEASIGHIQSNGETGIVDWVVTPTIGTGWMIAEDAVDKHLIKRFEAGHRSRFATALVRSLLNPSRSFANLMRWKKPWYRDSRDPGVTVH